MKPPPRSRIFNTDFEHPRRTAEQVRTLNFAEAALLIRGSSLIYSKKVDYLYELVFKVLDTVCAQKDKRIRVDLHADDHADGGGLGEDGLDGLLGGGGGGEGGTAIDLVSTFLSLDDVVEDPKATMGASASSSFPTDDDHTGADGVPQKLTAPEWDVDKRRAEAMQFAPPLAFLHAVKAQTQSGAEASSSFQLSVSRVHESGALLINPNGETNYNVLSDHTTAMCAAGDTYTSALRDVLHAHTAAHGFGPGGDHGPFDHGGGEGDDFYDDDGGGGGDGGFDDFGDMGGMGGGLDFQAGYGQGGSMTSASFGVDKPVSKQLSKLFGQAEDNEDGEADDDDDEEEEEDIDYWALHNPHDDSGANKRPFRMGKTFSVPDLSQAQALPQGPVIASLLVNDTVASSSSSSSVASREFGYILRVAKKIKKELVKRRKQLSAAKKARKLHQAAALAASDYDGASREDGYQEDEAGAAAQAAAAMYGDVDISVAGASVSAEQHGGGGGEDGQFDYGEDNGDDGGFGGTFDDDYGDAFGPSDEGPMDASADGGAFTTFGGAFHHEQYSEDMDGEGADMYNSSYAQLCRSHGECGGSGH
jgi:hypothetical protein